MHLLAVKEIPGIERKKSGRNDICALVEEFAKAKYTKAEVILNEDEYSTPDVGYRTIFACVCNMGYSDKICVMKRGYRIFMMKLRRNKSK